MPYEMDDFKVKGLIKMPSDGEIYAALSKKIDPEKLEKLNAAIEGLKPC